MDWLSFWKRKSDGAVSPSATPVDSVAQIRTRARRRLIGAAVLVLAGIVGFPLVFETQPRPIPIDLPIEIPHKDNVAPLATVPHPASAPAANEAPASATASALPPSTAASAAPVEEILTEEPVTAPPAMAAAPASHASARPPAAPASRPAVAAADGERARALLEAKPEPSAPASAAAGRFIVQVGAFADEGQARQTRQKVERMGMKTYTQVANTPAGPRIRVRVGPFASRAEADAALAKAKGAGLAAVVLTL